MLDRCQILNQDSSVWYRFDRFYQRFYTRHSKESDSIYEFLQLIFSYRNGNEVIKGRSASKRNVDGMSSIRIFRFGIGRINELVLSMWKQTWHFIIIKRECWIRAVHNSRSWYSLIWASKMNRVSFEAMQGASVLPFNEFT